ncbi:hypothetical protein MGG_17760 [Pyricularia oryzae 70-15]|uniref:C2H2-type domain-containing protein n=1 Tax=Pyricularia oryzae (strain 70-15 / ATCC MYA-4617 / FGSC 8958) TaxID=242507 RepID=G4NHN4_PYRO7|nr:uncharacterized protein MGG_17760 [Pyricularia oryzae 70-15]EHA47744.1 hypothetical protein MGG_17760 [Pyricularia oryzae 70-15]KAI7909774.1 hypothetical protein M0657_011684 [Pyricularia oryzae]KAI7909789.1 hypothetical protein M9X92_011451 [Pyricularia oryzae]
MRTSTFFGILTFFAVGITAVPIGCDSSAVQRRGDNSGTKSHVPQNGPGGAPEDNPNRSFKLPKKGGREAELTILPFTSHCNGCGERLRYVGTMRNHQDRRPACKGKGYYVKQPST